jgi:hypothetical protein
MKYKRAVKKVFAKFLNLYGGGDASSGGIASEGSAGIS